MKRYKDLLSCFAAILVFSLICIFPVFGQANTGDITGRVTDEQGKVVPGAVVTAIRQGTAAGRTTTTDQSGDYTLTNLPPGKYDITVESQNFSKALAKDFELNVGAK